MLPVQPGWRLPPGKSAALSQYPRNHEGKRLMGYSLRTGRYRYTEWRVLGTSEVLGRELYDYQQDPQESRNRAGDQASRALIEQLAKQLRTLVRS